MPSALAIVEATASISDTSGNLLFYSNGEWVMNAQDSIMPNGSGLLGCNSSTQGALIVPRPQNPDQYYLFTTSCYEQNFTYGLQYHIIDMSLNNGLGDVVVKNQLVALNVAEELAATYHTNNCDVWIACHELYTDNYHTYLLTDTGLVTTPVTSQVGPLYQSSSNAFGRTSLRFNRSGTLAAQSPRRVNGTNVHQFDRTTGLFSAYLAIPWHPMYNDPYSAVFSPNDSLLYVSGWSSGSSTISWIVQYDLSRPTAQEIADSAYTVMIHGGSLDIGQLQIAPDGKIYGSQENSPYLTVINSPDLAGQACNFVQNGQLCTSNSLFGLPNFVSQFTGQGPAAVCSGGVAIESENARQSTHVYPNPFHESARIEFEQAGDRIYDLMVVDMMGAIVLSASGIQNSHRIDRGDLPNGVYSYMLLADGETIASGRLLLR